MPLFGIDDVIFLLISTSFLFLAQKGDVPQVTSHQEDAAAGYFDVTSGPKIVDSKREKLLRKTFSTSPLLLPGFQLSSEKGFIDNEIKRYRPVEKSLSSSSLIEKSGVLSAFIPEYAPVVPHRQYNAHKNIPQVGSLTTLTKEEVAACIHRFTPRQVSSLFQEMEAEGLWESALEISEGIQMAGLAVKYLSQANVERLITTLVNEHQMDRAVDSYFKYGQDMLIADELLILLFDACRFSKHRCMKLYRQLVPFQSRWSEVVYSCCIIGAAQWDPPLAMDLYKSYCAFQKVEQEKGESMWMRFLPSSALLQDSGVVRKHPISKFGHLYHVMVPLVVNHFPDLVYQYVADMMRNQPEVAPDVFLKCLLLSHKKETKEEKNLVETLVRDFLQDTAQSGDYLLNVSSMAMPELALTLYQLRPSPMNMNSLVHVLITLENHKDPGICGPESPSSLSSSIPAISPVHLRFQKLLEKVPLENTHARILARTVTDGRASWGLTSVFLHTMLQRQQFSVVPTLVRHLSRMGKWSAAAAAMSIYMSNRCSNSGRLSPPEVSMCIEACTKAGKWNSVLFWVQRASTSGSLLPPTVYDTALSACQHIPWEKTEQLIQFIRRSGGTWSDIGYAQLVESSARQGKLKQLLRLIPSGGRTSDKGSK